MYIHNVNDVNEERAEYVILEVWSWAVKFYSFIRQFLIGHFGIVYLSNKMIFLIVNFVVARVVCPLEFA